MNGEPLVLVRNLTEPIAAPRCPDGLARLAFTAPNAVPAHAILAEAYADGFGEVAGFADWYDALVSDEEYDAELCFIYGSGNRLAGFAQVWTSGFVKDIAVANAFRRQGIGRALMLAAFAELQARGLDQVRLKVHPDNQGAIALYRALGMRAP